MAETAGPLRCFVFTDIEGSTRAWETAAGVMDERLVRHDSVLRDAFARHDGRVFSTGGDGFAVVFDDVGDAVVSALEVQAALCRRSAAGADGHSRRSSGGTRRRLLRPDLEPDRSLDGGGPRGSGVAVRGCRRARPVGVARGSRAARPRHSPAARPHEARAHLAAPDGRHSRVPAVAVSRRGGHEPSGPRRAGRA